MLVPPGAWEGGSSFRIWKGERGESYKKSKKARPEQRGRHTLPHAAR